MTISVHPSSFTQLALGLEPRRRAQAPAATQGTPCGSGSQSADTFDAAGRAIGRDYARHGLIPSPDHLYPGHPVRQGWEAGHAALVRRGEPARPASRHVRRWLELRLKAWMHGRAFDALQVTPGMLARIETARCPVTREALAPAHEAGHPRSVPGAAGAPDEGVVVALREEAGIVAGNLVLVSRRAARALASEGGAGLVGDATGDATGDAASTQLGEAALRRAADLRALVTPMPHARASARPLTVLPPPRVRVLNPAHELQVLLATLFAGGAYARRMSALGTLMPDAASRRAYAALMSTLLARRLESEWAAGREQLRALLEDAWVHPMVQRRWAELMQQLTPAQCTRIVRRAVERGLAAGRARWLEPERAVEGWGA
jgi:hypothetical protein